MLLDRYQNRVYGLVYSMIRNETASADLLQDVFLKIWKALPSFRCDSSFSSWIYTIARNTALTELKRVKPSLSLDDPEVSESLAFLPEFRLEPDSAGENMDITAMLDQLSDKYRVVVMLFYLEQKSYEEVSEMLGIPMGSVKTILHRAKKELLRIGARSIRSLPTQGTK
ncbi:MAG: polymerase, sigma-24 subunit, subfamily [Verrucomicrobiales bacterium]|nr:polymerase, sigma-24 subunit, subfamily [Verrucomicrobiales bacterium]